MEEEKKEIKKPSTYTLKPVNIAWLIEQAFKESTPEKRVSARAVLDRIIDQARQDAAIPSPVEKKRSAQARQIAIAI